MTSFKERAWMSPKAGGIWLLAFFMLLFWSSIALAQANPPPGGGGGFWSSIGGTIGGALGQDELVPLSTRIQQFSDPDSCWGCNMFVDMASTVNNLGNQVSSQFSGSLQRLLSSLMGVWVMWQLIKMGGNVSGSVDSSGLLQGIVNKLFIFVILLGILSADAYGFISQYFIFPFFEASSGFANRILVLGGGGGGNCGTAMPSGVAGTMGAGVTMMCSLHLTVGKGLAIGRYLLDLGFVSPFGFDFGALFGGLFIMIVFFYLSAILPFRLFDSLIRLAVIAVILPVLVVAFQFQVSRGAVRQGVSSVIVACLNFVFVAVAVAISLTILDGVIPTDGGDAQEGFGPMTASQFMLLIGMAFGMAAFVRMAGSLAAEFAGFQGQQGEVGAAAPALIAKGGTMAATAVAAGVGFGAYKGVGRLAGGAQMAGKALSSSSSGAGKAVM